MEKKIICIGDNVWDKYLSRGKMYPGGQCVNTCVYAGMNGVPAAYLGQFGDDGPARLMQELLEEKGIDFSRSRQYPGEDGFAIVTLRDGDRVFLGSNKGGVARLHPYGFTEEDFAYIQGFALLYTNINCHIEDDLPALSALGVPVAFDFSDRWTPAYLGRVCPYIQVACLSCAHLVQGEMEKAMRQAASYGASLVLGTRGEEGSWALCRGGADPLPSRPRRKGCGHHGRGGRFPRIVAVRLVGKPRPRRPACRHGKSRPVRRPSLRAGGGLRLRRAYHGPHGAGGLGEGVSKIISSPLFL